MYVKTAYHMHTNKFRIICTWKLRIICTPTNFVSYVRENCIICTPTNFVSYARENYMHAKHISIICTPKAIFAYQQRPHAHSKWGGTCVLRFLSKVDFESSFQKTKNSRIMFVIFDTITLYSSWLERSVRLSSAAKFKSAFVGWHWARDRRVYTALSIIANHTWFCWAYECNDQSEAFRWVRWVQGVPSLTEFPGEFSHQKQQSAQVRTMWKISISQFKQLQWL